MVVAADKLNGLGFIIESQDGYIVYYMEKDAGARLQLAVFNLCIKKIRWRFVNQVLTQPLAQEDFGDFDLIARNRC